MDGDGRAPFFNDVSLKTKSQLGPTGRLTCYLLLFYLDFETSWIRKDFILTSNNQFPVVGETVYWLLPHYVVVGISTHNSRQKGISSGYE